MNWIRSRRVYVDGHFAGKVVGFQDGIITEILDVSTFERDFPGVSVRDFGDLAIVPGFVDIHTHGAVGIDVNGATADDFAGLDRFYASRGVTSWLSSILTDTKEQTMAVIREARKYKEMHPESGYAGIHLEGPFLSAAYKGAMPEHLLRKGDAELVRTYQEAADSLIRYMTVSPEVEGVCEMIPQMKDLDIAVAIGHSGADYETAMKSIEAGAVSATHTMNAMRLWHQHDPGIHGAALERDIYCEAICDGRHLHPGTVRLLMKIKGPDRIVAITDSIMAAGLGDGEYRLGVNEIIVEGGDAKLKSTGVRAGSTLTMDQALRNILAFTGMSLEMALPLVTINPAKVIGLDGRIGTIEVGKQADFVVLGENNQVVETCVKGLFL